MRISDDYLPAETLQRVAADSTHYLCTPSRNETYVEAHFTATMLAADMVHAVMHHDAAFLQQQFASSGEVRYSSPCNGSSMLTFLVQRNGRGPPPIRAWSALALSALSDTSTLAANHLLVNISSFSLTYAASLQALSMRLAPTETYALDLNQVYTAIKLWMMLCRKRETTAHNSQLYGDIVLSKGVGMSLEEFEAATKERTVWNELWPPFENVLAASAIGDGSEDLTVSLPLLATDGDARLTSHDSP